MDPFVAYRSSQITSDTAEALRALERTGRDQGGVKIHYRGVPRNLLSWEGVEEDPGPTGLPPHLSMRPAGREVYLRAELTDFPGPESMRESAEIAAMWSLAVPLGFVPWSRWPVPGPHSRVFHYLGPWAPLGDFLQGEGRGEEAWPSMVAAAQSMAGAWEGTKPTERSVQSHLHRLGIHCGPVDGQVGERTLQSLRALGFAGLPLTRTLEALEKMEATPPTSGEGERRVGHFSMDGVLPEAFTSGQIHTVKTKTGYAVTVDGSGRLILLFGEYQ